MNALGPDLIFRPEMALPRGLDFGRWIWPQLDEIIHASPATILACPGGGRGSAAAAC